MEKLEEANSSNGKIEIPKLSSENEGYEKDSSDRNKTGEDNKSSYRQIFKSTTLFGGVQVFNIIIGIVRVKFVAILLGATGVGMIGLFNSPLQMIMSLTGLGIALSAVRNISEANGNENSKQIAKAVKTLKKWSLFTGVLGAFVTILLSKRLSIWSFGNDEYTWAFIWLSVTVVLLALSKGQTTILQGTRRLKDMAKAGVVGSALGLFTSIPLYYFYGTKGIVPAIILTAISTLVLSWYFTRKIKLDNVKLTYKETISEGVGLAKLGISMTLAGFIAAASGYVLNAFISNVGGIEYVGLYVAGWGIVGQYTNVVFTAMATDYFPRLSAIQGNNKKVGNLVCQQGEIAILIMTPLLTLLIVTMPIVIRTLYTSAFLPVVMFANLTVLGMQFKALSWSMGYVLLAKGEGRLFLILEIISGSVILILNLIFYYYFGLDGLGVSFILSYLIGVIIIYTVLRRKYQFSYNNVFIKRFGVAYGLVVFAFSTIFIPHTGLKYFIGVLILMGTAYYSYRKLNELMDVKRLIKNRILKRK